MFYIYFELLVMNTVSVPDSAIIRLVDFEFIPEPNAGCSNGLYVNVFVSENSSLSWNRVPTGSQNLRRNDKVRN